jgi:glycine C-acetyltransferase
MAYIQHGSAPFMFSAALCPAAAAAALEALSIIISEKGRRSQLRLNQQILRNGIRRLGFDTGRSDSPVIPVLLGDTHQALQAGRDLWGLGVCASTVIPPAVPQGKARFRLCATASMKGDHLEEALRAFGALTVPGRTELPDGVVNEGASSGRRAAHP